VAPPERTKPPAIAETGPVTERVQVREADEDEGRRLVPGAATAPTTNGFGGSAAGQTQLDAALVRAKKMFTRPQARRTG
jgi:hypothetical protein